MSNTNNPPQKKLHPVHTTQPDVGAKYEISVATLVAANLSKNKQVENYQIFTNLLEAHPFDDVVVKVFFKGDKVPYAYAMQVKHVCKGKTLNDKCLKKYLNGYSKILNHGRLETMGDDIAVKNIHFCYFCIKDVSIADHTLREHESTNEWWESISCFKKCFTLYNESASETDKKQQDFLDKFYMYFDQPNVNKIREEIEKVCEINDADDILKYVDKFFVKTVLWKSGLSKEIFETELLKIRLADHIVSPTAIIQLSDSQTPLWNQLVLQNNATIVKAEINVEKILFGCLAQMLNNILNNVVDWEMQKTKGTKGSRVISEFQKLFDVKNMKRVRHWIEPPPTLKSLIIELWKCGDLPLILRSDTNLPVLKDYKHLNKKFIIITESLADKWQEYTNYNLTTFAYISDIKCTTTGDKLLNAIQVSLQGRKPITLHSIIHRHEQLAMTLTCSQILHLMKTRKAYLNKEYLDLDNHDHKTIFLVEDSSSPLEYNDDDINSRLANITIRCRPEQITEYRKKIETDHKFKHYEIYHCVVSSENKNLILIDGNKTSLRDFFVDQDGEGVYCLEDNVIPILGHNLQSINQNYISRSLCSAVVNESLFDLEIKAICLFTGDLNYLNLDIRENMIKVSWDNIERIKQLSIESIFINGEDIEDIEKYWKKLSGFKRPLLHIRVEDTGMQLCRSSNWKGLSDHISFSGRVISEENFLSEMTDGITVVTGEPGIGKTSLLQSLFKNHSTEKYILFYNLVDYKLVRKNKTMGKNFAINLLLSKFENQRYGEFLSELFKRKEKLLVILDSFDEVLPSHKEETLDFVRDLAASNIQIIIASRLIANSVVMENFDTNIYKVHILTADDQKEYMKNGNLSEKVLSENIPREFLENPLYLSFIKIIFEQNEHLAHISKLALFDKVTEIKKNRYFERYFSSDHICDQKYLLEYVLKLHHMLALVKILGMNAVKNVLNWEYKEKHLHQLKLGIVLCVDENSYPTFVHETFAEYLVADWLIKNKTESCAKDIYQEILKQKKLYILDILCEHLALHKAVLEGVYEEIVMYAEDRSHLERTDELGRTAAHVAAAYHKESHYHRWTDDIIQKMCEHEVNYASSDFPMQWNWVQHLNRGNIISLRRLPKLKTRKVREAYLNCIAQKLREGVELCIKDYSRDEMITLYKDALIKCNINCIRSLFFIEDTLVNGASQASKHQNCQALESDVSNLKKIRGFTPLHVACICGNLEIVRKLIELKHDLNATDDFGCIPLHYSVIDSSEVYIEITKMLIEEGSKVDNPNKWLFTPTISAVSSRNVDTMDLLLKKCTPNTETLELLLLSEKYADRERRVAPKERVTMLVNLLLGRGVNANDTSKINETMILAATQKADLEYWKELVNDFRYMGVNRTLLMRAIETGNPEIVKLLLAKGANVNGTAENGATPLIVALECWRKDLDCIKVLLQAEAGMNVNCITKYDESQLNLPLKDNNSEVVKLPIEELMGYTQEVSDCKKLLPGAADISCAIASDKLPLMFVAEEDDSDTIQLLIRREEDILLQSDTTPSKPPLVFTARCFYSNSDRTKSLLEAYTRSTGKGYAMSAEASALTRRYVDSGYNNYSLVIKADVSNEK